MVEDLNSIFEEPDKEEDVLVSPNSEVEQDNIELAEEEAVEASTTEQVVEETMAPESIQDVFNLAYTQEQSSPEFIDELTNMAKFGLYDMPGGLTTKNPEASRITWGEIKLRNP